MAATVGTQATHNVAITDPDIAAWGDTLTYVARQNGGAALPSWVQFDEAGLNFVYNATVGATNIVAEVEATDS